MTIVLIDHTELGPCAIGALSRLAEGVPESSPRAAKDVGIPDILHNEVKMAFATHAATFDKVIEPRHVTVARKSNVTCNHSRL
ncbi:hypothetical protein CTheo_7878 [Ceratobasidium theobromae]|uniref:Uncharacterized protein n=1 Tax=Ceratobasidium theobromae TaxID=1582974 RepID=A0A5N5QBA9_9AGAM|nr:hypothetical protein CTheo_7878 [Ceratobasidium theobromae]